VGGRCSGEVAADRGGGGGGGVGGRNLAGLGWGGERALAVGGRRRGRCRPRGGVGGWQWQGRKRLMEEEDDSQRGAE
jgi:hypothetical protein